MRTKLTNTVIAKLAVPEGKQSVKLFDTDVGGLGVRKVFLIFAILETIPIYHCKGG